ncbi:unnamed protein product, partial [Effrenium voratum]
EVASLDNVEDTAPAYLLATTDGVLAAVNNRLDFWHVDWSEPLVGECLNGSFSLKYGDLP